MRIKIIGIVNVIIKIFGMGMLKATPGLSDGFHPKYLFNNTEDDQSCRERHLSNWSRNKKSPFKQNIIVKRALAFIIRFLV